MRGHLECSVSRLGGVYPVSRPSPYEPILTVVQLHLHHQILDMQVLANHRRGDSLGDLADLGSALQPCGNCCVFDVPTADIVQ